MTWGDLAARAAGRALHRLSPAALAAIDGATDGRALVDALVGGGWSPLGLGAGGPAAIEHALRRAAAEELAIVERWAGDRRAALAAILDDEDRRSLRALLRGLAGAVPLERRLAAAIPTPRLPEPVLRALAEAPTPAALAALLARHDHPLAAPLLAALAAAPDRPDPASTRATAIARPAAATGASSTLAPPARTADTAGAPALLALERALTRAVVARARSDRRGGVAMARYLAQLVDADNAGAALALAARGGSLAPAAGFLDGGERLARAEFVAAATAPPDRAAALVARAFAGTPVAAAVHARAPDALEDAALAWQLATQVALRRADPTSLAAVLVLLLRGRVEARRVRRAAWRIALGGAP